MTEIAYEKRIKELREENYGFLTEGKLKELVGLNRLFRVLVRCGGGRFICPAQDAAHFIKIIGTEGTDYVRDVSFPAN